MINLYLIRHGEALHNVLFKQHGMKTFFDCRIIVIQN